LSWRKDGGGGKVITTTQTTDEAAAAIVLLKIRAFVFGLTKGDLQQHVIKRNSVTNMNKRLLLPKRLDKGTLISKPIFCNYRVDKQTGSKHLVSEVIWRGWALRVQLWHGVIKRWCGGVGERRSRERSPVAWRRSTIAWRRSPEAWRRNPVACRRVSIAWWRVSIAWRRSAVAWRRSPVACRRSPVAWMNKRGRSICIL
jgi:hypothetical protein